MNVQQTIAKANWVATDQQVEQLAAAQYHASAEAEGYNLTYLRVLVVRVQSKVGTKRRGRQLAQDAALAVIEQEATPLYAAVLRGITTPDIAPDDTMEPTERSRRALERNRRSTFARSAKTTLVNYVRGGGDIRTLDPASVSKASLRAAIAPPEPTNRTERSLERAQGAWLRALNRLARGDPDAARTRLEAMLETLQARLDALEPQADVGGQTTTVVAQQPPPRHTRTRVGVPQLHRGA